MLAVARRLEREAEPQWRPVYRPISGLVEGRAIRRQSRAEPFPFIGPLTATALVAFVGEIHRFASGRRFTACLGLVPKEHSSGETRRLGRISKRGDCYLRMLLIHGTRSVLWAAKKQPQPDRLSAWALRIEATRGHNKAAVALANKLARTAWSVWHGARSYEARALQTAA